MAFILQLDVSHWFADAEKSLQRLIKMVEQKDMCSSSSERAPKSQLLNNHQPEDTRTHQKKIPNIQGQRSKMVGGTQSRQNQIPNLWGGQPSHWITIIPKKFSHCCEGSRPHIMLPSLGIWQRDWESPGHLKASGISLKDSHRTVGNRVHSWGHQQNLVCTRTQGKGPVSPQETNLPMSVWGSPAEHGLAVAHCGVQGIGSSSPGICVFA